MTILEDKLLADLNEAQREVVGAPLGNMLVIAGAGSGKTRVLVHRMAWLVQREGVSPFGIYAVTFTNKAAAEMRGRVESILGISVKGMWVGTFHGLAHRLLRAHWEAAGLPEHFQILDGEDQQRIIRRLLKSFNLDESKWAPRKVQSFISNQKEAGRRSNAVVTGGNPFTETMLSLYRAYEETCERSGLVDFAELLLRACEMCEKNPDVLQHYQQRFSQILVDEFQDTNGIQYRWLKLLAGGGANIMAVGDDDQSIYSWRGAKIENIHSLSKDFSDVKIIRLEQNYRSTNTILQAANAVIEHNDNRMGKKLWTQGAEGDPIVSYAAFNEIDEARYIIGRIRDYLQQDYSRSDIAILYRSNAQSRVLEEQLLQSNIPYRVYGGFKFFERAEIKDALGYMRLMASRNDDAAFERVVNTPTRGIGNTTLTLMRDYARSSGVSMWRAAKALVEEEQLPKRAQSAVLAFLNLIDALSEQTDGMMLYEQTEHVLHHSGILNFYQQDRTEKGLGKVENLEELVSATREYINEDEALSDLQAFISQVALDAGDHQAQAHEECVQLMTLHAAKGLEFRLVFLSGLEEGLFPHKMSMQEPGRLEEERRLCYVGMTRAREKLFITHAESRTLYGMENYQMPSRFLSEIPSSCIQEVRMKTKVSTPSRISSGSRSGVASKSNAQSFRVKTTPQGGKFALGEHVNHPKFGEGVVIAYEGHGSHMRVQLRFKKFGLKWLVMSYAKLEAV